MSCLLVSHVRFTRAQVGIYMIVGMPATRSCIDTYYRIPASLLKRFGRYLPGLSQLYHFWLRFAVVGYLHIGRAVVYDRLAVMYKYSLLARLFTLYCLHRSVAEDVGANFDTNNTQAFEHDFGSYPFKTFKSSDLTSPVLRRPIDSPQCHDDNYIFLSPRGYQVSHSSVMVMDNEGEIIWGHYVEGQAYNLKVQEYQGEQVLTFWVGNDGIGGHGEGDYYMVRYMSWSLLDEYIG
jgi:hypothetical protein